MGRDRFFISATKLIHTSYANKRNWFKLLLTLKGSVIPAILPRVIFCGLFAWVISAIYYFGYKQVSLDILSSLVPSIVLGLLLVFRTNTAYDRFWEGRKLWGTLVNTVRNLARGIWVCITETKPEDRIQKIKALRLLVAFAIATKLHLRSEEVNQELADLMPDSWFQRLKTMNHPPLEIAFWLADYLQKQSENDKLSAYQLVAMQKLINILVDCLGGCERIIRTPLPMAYSIHLRQLLLIYCLSLPFQVVEELVWFTGPFVALISFTVFGIEEIGIEIENPFGYDANDLPLDQICHTMQVNIEDLITFEPCVKHWQNETVELDT
ncbi:bestrophin family protein [Gloeocapsa sp. PCC 73106]|uniref:bestrophin family protein n=1 Tax=Gloeocapsa sp. PCC 73106 TaxID=102232 RepID=UPI0002AD0A86|nr:bestrophin family ion channel [Gloeocapsa sp. PCC 73106]ELR98246.1 putative membrane protein [Gloeocapsa sp. PCC 73106]